MCIVQPNVQRASVLLYCSDVEFDFSYSPRRCACAALPDRRERGCCAFVRAARAQSRVAAGRREDDRDGGGAHIALICVVCDVYGREEEECCTGWFFFKCIFCTLFPVYAYCCAASRFKYFAQDDETRQTGLIFAPQHFETCVFLFLSPARVPKRETAFLSMCSVRLTGRIYVLSDR